MAAEYGQPIMELRHLFRSAARAVVAAQVKLDEAPPPASPPTSPQPFPPVASYSIPRAQVSLSFGLEETNSRRFLIPFFRSQSNRLQLHAHELTFSVIAAPEPPPAPRGVAEADGEEGQDGRTLFPVTLTQPHFFVPPEEQESICRRLADAMEAGRWEFVYPQHGETPSDKKVRREAERIRENIHPQQAELGMVVFELDTAPPTFLVVRVTGEGEQDGVFVYAPGQETEAFIYSFGGDDIENIRYKALHQFALTVRHWLAGAPPRRTRFAGLDVPPANGFNGLGLLALSEFTGHMTEGYLSGLRFVSANGPSGTPPPRVDLSDVRAQLRYSVYYDGERLRFSFGERRRPDGSRPTAVGAGPAADGRDEEEDEPTAAGEEITVIESRTVIRASRADGWPRVEVELVTPEFSLSGRAREFVTDAVAAVAAEVSVRLDGDEPDFYVPFLERDSYRRGAVVFLSYEGKVPKQEFLIIWPGVYRETPRDFIFTCKLKEGKIDVGSVGLVMSLKQDLEDEGVGLGVELDGDQYEPFHNFFHAVRMWVSRTDSERNENRS